MGCCFSTETEEERAAQAERDREARMRAAEAAERRQQEYENTPHGRATKASIEKANKERAQGGSSSDGPLMRWQVG